MPLGLTARLILHNWARLYLPQAVRGRKEEELKIGCGKNNVGCLMGEKEKRKQERERGCR